jgi:hypothetical protein
MTQCKVLPYIANYTFFQVQRLSHVLVEAKVLLHPPAGDASSLRVLYLMYVPEALAGCSWC